MVIICSYYITINVVFMINLKYLPPFIFYYSKQKCFHFVLLPKLGVSELITSGQLSRDLCIRKHH